MNENLYTIALLELNGFGIKTVNKIILENKNIFQKSIDDLYEIILNYKTITKVELETAIENSNIIIEKSKIKNINIITIFDQEYSKLLKNIDDAPPVIYAKGNLNLLNEKAIAVIGSRNHSEEAKEIAKEYVKELVKNDYIIVSGLANGIDTIGHETTLEHKGKTIAILPSSLDSIYPKENISLATRILENEGLLISEYPIGYKINKYSFVQRDRLQSGMSIGTLVIETSIKGGSMQTSKFTLKQNRKLLVHIPKDKTNLNDGNFKLIENPSIIKINNPNEIISYLETKSEKKGLNKYF